MTPRCDNVWLTFYLIHYVWRIAFKVFCRKAMFYRKERKKNSSRLDNMEVLSLIIYIKYTPRKATESTKTKQNQIKPDGWFPPTCDTQVEPWKGCVQTLNSKYDRLSSVFPDREYSRKTTEFWRGSYQRM